MRNGGLNGQKLPGNASARLAAGSHEIIGPISALFLAQNPARLSIAMTSTVTSKGQTVVPKALRERFNIKSGATLDWQEDGASLRVIKLESRPAGSFWKDCADWAACRQLRATNDRLTV